MCICLTSNIDGIGKILSEVFIFPLIINIIIMSRRESRRPEWSNLSNVYCFERSIKWRWKQDEIEKNKEILWKWEIEKMNMNKVEDEGKTKTKWKTESNGKRKINREKERKCYQSDFPRTRASCHLFFENRCKFFLF